MPDSNITITVRLVRRPWYKRIWHIPKVWWLNYRILRGGNGRLWSAYYGLRLALLLLPHSIKIGKWEYPLWP